MNEVWKPIEGFDRYEVSNMGRVRNLGGQLCRMFRGKTRRVPPRVLKPILNKRLGYCSVQLPGKKRVCVHQLVAKAFCEGASDGLVVDHINNIRHDNRAENLRWISNSENVARSYREGVKRMKKGADAMGAKPVVAVNLRTGEVMKFGAALEAERLHGFDSQSISRCCNGRQRSHLGWAFSFSSHGADKDD